MKKLFTTSTAEYGADGVRGGACGGAGNGAVKSAAVLLQVQAQAKAGQSGIFLLSVALAITSGGQYAAG